jgi:hypothetical protein
MRKSILTAFLFAAAAVLPTALASAQSLPELPAGYKADPGYDQLMQTMRAQGVSDGKSGKKQNDSWPKCISDPLIEFTYGWTFSPAPKTTLDMMAKSQDAPSSMGQMKTVPLGKRPYKNGIMATTKTVTMGLCGYSTKEIVTYSVDWKAATNDKLVTISVSRFYGSQEGAEALVDSYIGQVLDASSKARTIASNH